MVNAIVDTGILPLIATQEANPKSVSVSWLL